MRISQRILSLRVRMVLLVVVALIPATAVIFVSAQDRRESGVDQVRGQALSLARLTAVQYDQAIQSTRTFLLPLAQVFAVVPDLSAIPEEACQPFFATLVEADSRLVVVAAALPDGTVQCGSVKLSGGAVSVADEAFFKAALESRDFALGPVTTDSLSGATAIHAAYPVIGPDGTVRSVIYVGLDVTSLSAAVVRTGLPEGSFATIVDRDGTILARHPDPQRWVGQTAAAQPHIAEVLSHPAGLTVEGRSLEGTAVVIGAVGVPRGGAGNDAPPEVVVSVGIPSSAAYADVDGRLRTDLSLLMGVALVAAAGAWFGGGIVLRGLSRYVAAAAAITRGDFSVRTGPAHPRNELGDLGRAFDDMAAGLERRDQEIRALNEGLEQRVAERTEELEAANNDLEAFSYSVSHDLRAPLRAVDGFTRILLEEHTAELSEDARHYFSMIQGNARQMGELVDDLLTFSRMGRTPVSVRPVRLDGLFQDVFEGLKHGLDGRQVDFAVHELPPCEADPALIRQVIQNLLDNALKFTRARDVARIRVSGRANGDMSEYSVQDNGVGFDMRYGDKLFGVFQRLHRADEYEGTGVGLAIVQRVVQRHGGQVWFEAAPDQGATFSFSLRSGVTE